MKKHYVKTSNYNRFMDGIQAVEERGAQEASMMLVWGEAGYGKTQALTHWATHNDAIFLRANVDWTPRYFMIEMAKLLKIDIGGTAEQLFSRLMGSIAKKQTPIVIDEADHCLRNGAEVLEKVRDFADRTEALVILSGMEKIQGKIARHPQVSSRIARSIEFIAATVDDTVLLCAEKCEIKVHPDLAGEMRKQTDGRVREIINAIALVERIGQRAGKEEITLADMAGQTLTNNWQSTRQKIIGAKAGR
ncbi:MAG: ATP-binding protein [Sulfuricellaceae bacterium]